jgi:hypothetical protein
MSRKIYAQTALAIRATLAETEPQTRAPVATLARCLADMFKKDNPAFRYDRFFTAAGLDNRGELTPNQVYPNGFQAVGK